MEKRISEHDTYARFVTFQQLAMIYQVSLSTVRYWKQHGNLPGLRKLGGRYRVDLDVFEKSTYVDPPDKDQGGAKPERRLRVV